MLTLTPLSIVSYPLWVRGLKHLSALYHRHLIPIVPFTGTGIKAEPYEGDKPIKPESYPSWVRGLKNGGRKDEQRRI